MALVQGTWEPAFDGVVDALSSSLDAGGDVGASVAVFLHGEPVVDVWGGSVDEAGSAPWERDTITNVWSTTKTMTWGHRVPGTTEMIFTKVAFPDDGTQEWSIVKTDVEGNVLKELAGRSVRQEA